VSFAEPAAHQRRGVVSGGPKPHSPESGLKTRG